MNKLYIKDQKSERTIFIIEDVSFVPNIDESIFIENEWFRVTERSY